MDYRWPATDDLPGDLATKRPGIESGHTALAQHSALGGKFRYILRDVNTSRSTRDQSITQAAKKKVRRNP